MNLVSVRLITDDVARLVAFYEHVTGVAALLAGRMPPGSVADLLAAQADPIPCPPPGLGRPPVCAATADGTSFFGHGRVDALEASIQDIINTDVAALPAATSAGSNLNLTASAPPSPMPNGMTPRRMGSGMS